MTMSTIKKPIIAKEIKEELHAKTQEEKQVIVHVCYPANPFPGNLIRIWPTTFLIDEVSGHHSKLIHAENISVFPYWTEVQPMKDFWFTLVFSGLPADCKQFSLDEQIPESGGFYVPKIERNRTDVYRIKIS